ncbi:MAG: hypothetical protein ABL934_02420 [Lysobacteraceae bacterium]
MPKIAQAAQRQSKEARTNSSDQSYSIVASKRPTPGVKWRFGFGFFREIKYFGLDGSKVKNDWLVSVIYRFFDLGSLTVEEIIGNKGNAEGARCHPINWEQQNIPIAPDDLDWLPINYKNSAEFPLVQFAVSRSLGRVIGFFDEEWAFQVVLLDPLHNAQPSKSFNYAVDLCKPMGCELTALRKKVDSALTNSPECDCGIKQRLIKTVDLPMPGMATVVCIARDDLSDQAFEIIESGLAKDFQDLIQHGVDACLAKTSS